MKRVLVTGANGFIGRTLCKKMLADGWQVRGAVRGVIQMTALSSRVEGVQVGDIDPDTDWSKALNGVDAVVHLAARVHVMDDTASNSLSAFRWVNVKGTARLAQQAVDANVRRFFFMSSVKVNGKDRDQPYTEEDMPEPLDPYGISKWEAELVLQENAEMTGLEVVILRPPLVYGPGVKANFLRLLESVARGVPLPLLSINNRRSLIYIENLVDAVFTCLSHPEVTGQTFLVSDGEDVSTPELIRRIGFALERPAHMFPFPIFLMRLIGRLLGKSAEIERLLGSLMVDCSKIKRELNWKPPYTMAQGLKETAKWYEKSC
jgi:nucleoside-diphosphate-sugar epimerase